VEAHVDIQRELAVLVERNPSGYIAAYPVMETRQHDAICHDVLAPVALPAERADEARRLAVSLADGVDVAGLLAVELFLAPEVLVNELALRPTTAATSPSTPARPSQFEQHLRAILDRPLGDTRLLAPPAAMVNVLGTADGPDPTPHLAGAFAVPKPAFASAPRYRGPAASSATSPPWARPACRPFIAPAAPPPHW
jgi:5-(carboxyamino)imidazole ribonucleotide synthase